NVWVVTVCWTLSEKMSMIRYFSRHYSLKYLTGILFSYFKLEFHYLKRIELRVLRSKLYSRNVIYFTSITQMRFKELHKLLLGLQRLFVIELKFHLLDFFQIKLSYQNLGGPRLNNFLFHQS